MRRKASLNKRTERWKRGGWRRGEGRLRQCQLYLEERHAETRKWQWKFNQEGHRVFWHKHTLVGQTHGQDEGWWPAVTFVLWRLLCHGGWVQENDSPDTNWHAAGTASATDTSSPPSVPLSLCFPSAHSQETTTSCCVPKLTTYFQSQLFKQWRTDEVENWSTPHPQCL